LTISLLLDESVIIVISWRNGDAPTVDHANIIWNATEEVMDIVNEQVLHRLTVVYSNYWTNNTQYKHSKIVGVNIQDICASKNISFSD
jgi:hypothetical protein